MTVFHVKIDVHTTKFGELVEAGSADSEVFLTREEAYAWGRSEIDRRIKRYYREEDFKGDGGIEAFVKDQLYGEFTIIEVDPERRHKIDERENALKKLLTEECIREQSVGRKKQIDEAYAACYAARGMESKTAYCRSQPYRLEHSYDLLGNYISTLYWETADECYAYFPGDEEKTAGTRFKLGDIVTCPLADPNRIYVIDSCPAEERTRYWENTYELFCVENDRAYNDVSSRYGFQWHESHLIAYDGEVKPDSPLGILSRINKGEIKLSRDDEMEIFHGNVALPEIITIQDFLRKREKNDG